MVSAGLAGSSPHMVAASVAALSRLFFDFHTQLQSAMLADLVQTVELFLTSNNREIVRSVLGFVKVAVVVLPEDTLRPRLNSLVPNLMVWSKEHKGRLRSKVKGILDRLMRRFGAPLLEELVGESDRKLVVNIRKQRERRKRAKKEGEAGEDEEEENQGTGQQKNRGSGGKSFTNAFDSTVYGSDYSDDSDADDDDASQIDIDEEGNTQSKRSSKANRKTSKQGEQYIRELSPEDNPLDLLAPEALANISTTKPSVRFLDTGPGSKKKNRPAKFGPDGRLIIIDDDDVEMSGGLPADGAEEQAGESSVNAYLAAVSGPDAIRRGQKGKLKISQAQKRKKDRDADGMDLDDDDNDDNQKNASAKGSNPNGRRGLGIPKTHGPSGSGRVMKRNPNKNRSGRNFRVGKRR